MNVAMSIFISCAFILRQYFIFKSLTFLCAQVNMEHTTECTVSGWCRCSDWADEEGNKLLANLDLKAIDNNTNIFDEETDLLFEQLNIKRIIANAKLAHLVGCNKKEDTCEGNM